MALLALTSLLFAGALLCPGQVHLLAALSALPARATRMARRRLAHLQALTCPHAPRSAPGSAVPAGGAALPQLPVQLMGHVAAGLEARTLCHLSLAAPELRWLLDEFCSYKLLLEEVRRMNLDKEWLAQLRASHDASAEDELECSPSRLRQFLASHRLVVDEEERLKTAERQLEVCGDVLRLIVLGICWCCFLCQVVRLATADEPHTPSLIAKAVISPFLFIYILEKGTESLRRSFWVGLVAVALLYDSVRRGR